MKSKMLERIFLSYVLIVVIILGIIGFFVTGYLFSQTNRQIEELTVNVLTRTGDAVDAELRSINSLAYQMSVNPEVMEFATAGYSLPGEKTFQANRVCKELSKSNMFVNLFDNIGIYFPKNDCIVDFETMYTPKEFFSTYFNQTDVSFDSWLDRVMESSKIRFIPAMEIVRNSKDNVSVLTYIQPLFGSGKEQAIMIAMIRSDTLLKYFNSAFEKKIGYFTVFDLYGNIIASSDRLPDTVADKIINGQAEEYTRFRAGGEDYISVVSKSGVVGLYYAYLMPRSEILHDAIIVRRIFIVGFILVLLFSVYIVFRNTKSRFSPIQSMADRIRDRMGNTDVDSLDMLDIFMGDMLDENDKLSHEIYSQVETVKSRFLSRLIWDSQSVTENELEDCKRSFGFELPYEKYCALIIGFADYSLLKRPEGTFDEYRIMDIVRTCGSKVAVENISTERDVLVYIINGDDTAIESFIEAVYSAAGKTIGEQIIFACGEIVSGIRQFSKTYEEAAAAQNYANKHGRYGIVRYSDIDERIKKEMYFPAEKESALVSAVKAGETDTVKSILDEIYRRNFTNDEEQRDELRCLIFAMVSAGIRIVNETSAGEDGLRHEYVNLCRTAVREHDLPKAFDMLSDKFLQISSAAQMQKSPERNSEQKIEERIRKYLAEHYTDKDISLLKVSEELNYSYKYMSSVFKELFGKKFTEYINLQRFERAKQLLMQTNMSVAQIADEVGYLSDGTFIKAFKKYAGVTPLKFREIQN